MNADRHCVLHVITALLFSYIEKNSLLLYIVSQWHLAAMADRCDESPHRSPNNAVTGHDDSV